MKILSLEGQWTLHAADDPETFYPATVPGCVHTDLLEAGLLPDPWYRDNEKDLRWVEHRDWVYTRTFELPPEYIGSPRHILRFEGLDTLCTLELNGIVLGNTHNMHRSWDFDVHPYLKAGPNTLTAHFQSPLPEMQRRDQEKTLPGWNLYHKTYRGKSYLRKMACAFGWDWGLMAPTSGIWQPAALLCFNERIENLRIDQHHTDSGDISLTVHGLKTDGAPGRVRLGFQGKPLLEFPLTDAAEFSVEVPVPDPHLWWPNGMGDQPLYDLTATLDSGHSVLKRIGLRTLALIREPDAFGESFRFRVNGRDIFMKGGNWIPCDIFPSRVQPETLETLLKSCAEAHMNMIRVWGGGIYEDDHFYELCDQLGLLVWQDFMFACSTYPTFDPEFMDNVRAEATDAVRRLRHHPCLALWCGNNELEQGIVRFDLDDWTDTSMPPQAYTPLLDLFAH